MPADPTDPLIQLAEKFEALADEQPSAIRPSVVAQTYRKAAEEARQAASPVPEQGRVLLEAVGGPPLTLADEAVECADEASRRGLDDLHDRLIDLSDRIRYSVDRWPASAPVPEGEQEEVFEEGDRVRVVESPSHPERVGRVGTVTLRRNCVADTHDYTVRLDGDHHPTGQYQPEWLAPAPEPPEEATRGDEQAVDAQVIDTLQRALYECYMLSGADTSDDALHGGVCSTVDDFDYPRLDPRRAVEAVRELRQEYDREPASPAPPDSELRERLDELDAWLSFRPEFGEVLTAFRSAFGTNTSADTLDKPAPTEES